MTRAQIVLVGLVAGLAGTALASAGHGITASLVGFLDDGAVLGMHAAYWSGSGERQRWEFAFAPAGPCAATGSWEVGFRDAGCAARFTVSGVGHAHSFGSGVDVHDVQVAVNGRPGTVTAVIVG